MVKYDCPPRRDSKVRAQIPQGMNPATFESSLLCLWSPHLPHMVSLKSVQTCTNPYKAHVQVIPPVEVQNSQH